MNKHRKLIFSIFISIAILILNIINSVIAEESIISSLFVGIGQALSLVTYIVMLTRPVMSIMTLTLSQVFYFLYDLAIGDSFSDSLSGFYYILLLFIISLLVHIIIADKQQFRGATKEDVKIIQRLKEDIIYKRECIKLKSIEYIVIYSIILTVIFRFSAIDEISTSYLFSIYTAFVIVIPLIEMLAIITTSRVAYQIFVIKTVVEIFTLISLIGHENIIIETIFLIIKALVLIYCSVWIRRENKNENKNENENEKQHQ